MKTIKSILASVALSFALISPCFAAPVPQAPLKADIEAYSSYLSFIEENMPYTVCPGDPFKTVIEKSNTVVVVIDDCFAHNIVQNNLVYETLAALKTSWNRVIDYRYRTGISIRVESGGWLGGIDTNNGKYYPPSDEDAYKPISFSF